MAAAVTRCGHTEKERRLCVILYPLEGLEEDTRAPPAEGPTRVALSRQHPARPPRVHYDGAPREGTIGAGSPSPALGNVYWRCVRTIAPIMAADALALAAAGMAARWLVLAVYPSAGGAVGWVVLLALLPLVAAYWMSGLYAEVWAHPVVNFQHLTHVTTIGLVASAVAAAVAAVAAGATMGPFPLWCAATWPGVVVLVPVARAFVHRRCEGLSWWGYPALVIGSGAAAESVAKVLLATPRSGLRPVLMTDPHDDCRCSILPVVNDASTLESLVRANQIRHAVVSLPDVPAARLAELLDRYAALIPHVLVLSDCSTLPTLWGASRSGGGRLSAVEVRNALLLETLQAGKRGVDVAVAAGVLLLGLPLLLGLAVLVKLSGPGPVLYGHTRVGRSGRPFKVWKFRTMAVDGDRVLRQHLMRHPAAREEWERDQKLRDDPRVTRAGRVMRRLSLDELPQAWNVLRGDMSLVGPRPIVRDEMRRYGSGIALYTKVKPGITGLWQVSGRNDTGYQDRVQLDLFYVRHWSPWLDAYILAKTVVALVGRNGAS
jgi:Undecaprenyl-phosphate galactose phosphotransferase WbaP